MDITEQLIRQALDKGVREFCICAGARNAALVYALSNCQSVKIYYWFEERSAGFFALGRSIATKRPVGVITTSGTAAGELLPSVMEAHYMGIPLMLITADRPRRFRETGAPQSAEQVDLYKAYVQFCLDIEEGDTCDLTPWNLQRPIQVNMCYEEPNDAVLKCKKFSVTSSPTHSAGKSLDFSKEQQNRYREFISNTQYPLVVVGGAPADSREALVKFLLDLNAPVYAEAISGIREDSRLSHLRVRAIDKAWKLSQEGAYPIDGILRIGGVPTARLWRDLEFKENSVKVYSISEQPFSGLSWGSIEHASIEKFSYESLGIKRYSEGIWKRWQAFDHRYIHALEDAMHAEPRSEVSLVHALSKKIPERTRVYLGNSLPIREWDLAATSNDRGYTYGANRGVNGIDGQISTFLGWSNPKVNHLALIGDLTALYDLAGPWILKEIPDHRVTIAIINNGGGQLFSRMFSNPAFVNHHPVEFSHFAGLWSLPYFRLEEISGEFPNKRQQMVEIVPDNEATKRFWTIMSIL